MSAQKKFCSSACYQRYNYYHKGKKGNCTECGKEIIIPKAKLSRKPYNGRFYCSYKCRNANRWKDPIREKAKALGLKGRSAIFRYRAMVKINPEVRCLKCGCDVVSIIEINHINGGGTKEVWSKDGWKDNYRFYASIVSGKRKTDDLDLRCKVCNAVHYVESKGIKGFKVTFEPPLTF